MIKQTYLTICILLVGWLTSCQEFEKRIDSPTVVDGNTVEVSIATNVPAITVQTRAKATEAEKWLEHVDVLVFKVDGTNETFAYRTTHTNDLSSLDYDNVSIKVKLNISENDEEYRVVFITNLKEEINQLFTDNDEITTSTSKEEVLKQIQFIQDENWVSQENRSRPLPMWGEANATVINSNTTNESFGTMDLLRSIARIELSVSLTDTGTGNTESNGSELFEITSVKVYNVREEGRAVPDKTNITDGKATDPTLIENSDKVDIKYLLTDTDKNAVSGIYVNEAKNQEDDVETSDPLFLVIGAIYKGEDSQNTDVTYYKVGFYDKANNPVDILRNYTYKMFITGVNGPGEEDEEEAAKSSSNSLTVAMLDWSEGEMKHVVFNGQNYLAVSESTLEISKSEATHKLFVQTNYLTGWKAEVLEGGDWITNLDPSSIPNDNNEEKTPFSFKVSENEEEERTGKIRFSCGDNHLALDIHVIQSTQKEYTLTVEIDDQDQAGSYVEFDKTITFTSGYHDLYESKGIDLRILKVTWTPTNEQLHVEFNRYFDWDDDETDITTYEDGYAEITVKPKRLLERDDWYPEAVGDIQLRVGEENGIGQNILIRRRHHEVYLEKADRYVVEANKEYSFKLYSNTSWKIMDPGRIDGQRTFMDMVDYQSINMTSGESTVGNNMEDSGVDIKFKFKNEDFGNVSADVSVLVVFDDLGEEIEKEYSFHIYREADPDSGTRFAEEANCYVLQAGGDAVSIPVSQANRKISATTTISNPYPIGNSQEDLQVKLIWADSPNGFNDNGPVKTARIDYTEGFGPKARLIVESGSKAGNAVIAVTNAQGDIHWSWHIWVVDDGFDPYNGSGWEGFRYYEFLDRNLGALSNIGGDPKSLGLYYQWGRKDPFPAAAGIKSTVFSDRYNEEGKLPALATYPNAWNETTENLFRQAMQRPDVFITYYGHWFSPNSPGSQVTSDFWNVTENGSISTSVKGVMDPCPEGWKTIPAGDNLHDDWYQLLQQTVYESSGHYTKLLGVMPHAGYINGSTGTLTDIDNATYWTGTTNDFDYAFRIQAKPNGNGHASSAINKSSGLSVRCMRRVATSKIIQ